MGNLCSIKKYKANIIFENEIDDMYMCMFSPKYKKLCMLVDKKYFMYKWFTNNFYKSYLFNNSIYYNQYVNDVITYEEYENKNLQLYKIYLSRKNEKYEHYQDLYLNCYKIINSEDLYLVIFDNRH
jgi:hypothetical protein